MSTEERAEHDEKEKDSIDLQVVKDEILREVEERRRQRGGGAWAPPDEVLRRKESRETTDSSVIMPDLDDAMFLREAYRKILKRDVDLTGFVDGMERLMDGESRAEMVWRLAESPEGRERGADPMVMAGKPPMAGTVCSKRRSLVGRIGSWLARLRKAPGNIITLGRDLRRQSLRVDWLATESVLFETARAAMVSSAQQQIAELIMEQRAVLDSVKAAIASNEEREEKRLETALDERMSNLQHACEVVGEGLQTQLDVTAEQSKNLLASVEEMTHGAQRASRQILRLEQQALLHDYRFAAMENQIRNTGGEVSQSAEKAKVPGWTPPIPQDVDGEMLYLSLENSFRGSEADIRNRLDEYVGRVGECGAGTSEKPVFDLGCGRGEWLEVLREHGYVARGVDRSSIMAGLCRQRGLEVDCSDAIEWLLQAKPESAGMITAFHVIEHIPFGDLVHLVDLSLQALCPGGILILETPNPENIVVATCNFYVDPTHIRPVPPDLLDFVVKSRGFDDVRIVRLHALHMVQEPGTDEKWLDPVLQRFNCSQDYAVIAAKPVAACRDNTSDPQESMR